MANHHNIVRLLRDEDGLYWITVVGKSGLPYPLKTFYFNNHGHAVNAGMKVAADFDALFEDQYGETI